MHHIFRIELLFLVIPVGVRETSHIAACTCRNLIHLQRMMRYSGSCIAGRKPFLVNAPFFNYGQWGHFVTHIEQSENFAIC